MEDADSDWFSFIYFFLFGIGFLPSSSCLHFLSCLLQSSTFSQVVLPGTGCGYQDPRRTPCRARFFVLQVFLAPWWISRQCIGHSIWWYHGPSYISTHLQAPHGVPATGATHQMVDTENEKYKLLCMWCIFICIYAYYSIDKIKRKTSTVISYLPWISLLRILSLFPMARSEIQNLFAYGCIFPCRYVPTHGLLLTLHSKDEGYCET